MLQHLRIIELGQVIAGTVAGMILGDLGAEVIKVEPPAGDAGRRADLYGVDRHSAIHLTYNRNKKSIALDLKHPRGRAVLLDLVRHADAVVENFRPGVLERLGVGYEQLREANDGIVLVSVTGFGADNSYRDFPAYDLIMQAMSGHLRIMGEPGRPPVIIGVPLADILAGVYAAIAVLAGVEQRRAGGPGGHFDIAMLDVMIAMLAHVGTLYLNTGLEQQPHGPAHPFIVPWQNFRCSDGEYVAVSPREERFWQRLVQCLGLPQLLVPEYANASARRAHREQLLPLLEAAFEQKPRDEWLAILRAADVPAAPVNTMAQMFADPYVRERRLLQSYELEGTAFRVSGNPLRLAGREEPEPAAPPPVGAHTDLLLQELLGYTPEQVAELRREGVVA